VQGSVDSYPGEMKPSLPRVFADRIIPLDALRGFIMILMALDHANHFIGHTHPALEMWGGPFPTYPDAFAFLIRFVTHLAAPGFSFLLGVGMALFASSRLRMGWSKADILKHFWLRGAFLILLQLLVINRAWEIYPGPFPGIYIGVLIALGGAMIIGSFLVWLPRALLILILAVSLIGMECIHPAPSGWGHVTPGWMELLFLQPGGDLRLWSNYPVLAWLEFAILGLAYGSWIRDDRMKALKYAGPIGLIFISSFVVMRAANGFGNIRPMLEGTLIGFLNLVKYPPSLTYFLLTMGINFCLLGLFAWMGEKRSRGLEPLLVFGRVPLFFYVVHLFLYAALGVILTPAGAPAGTMLALWLLGLATLYPLCVGFRRLRSKQGERSLLRLL
jgi:uncharacterized membrane protein